MRIKTERFTARDVDTSFTYLVLPCMACFIATHPIADPKLQGIAAALTMAMVSISALLFRPVLGAKSEGFLANSLGALVCLLVTIAVSIHVLDMAIKGIDVWKLF